MLKNNQKNMMGNPCLRKTCLFYNIIKANTKALHVHVPRKAPHTEWACNLASVLPTSKVSVDQKKTEGIEHIKNTQ